MEVSKYFQPVTLLAAILGSVQSIAWFVLSLLGILSYRCKLETPVYESASDQFRVTVVHFYFEGPGCEVNGSYIDKELNFKNVDLLKPDTLHGWMAAYLAFDITYLFISLPMLYYRNKRNSVIINLVRAWCVNTLAFLIMDVWLTIEFGFDYQDLTDLVAKTPDGDRYGWVTLVPGALMAIAARGFILWFLNLAILIYFVSYVINWKKLCEPKERSYGQSNSQHQSNMPHHRQQDAVLNDPQFRDILHAYRNNPRSSIDSWNDEKPAVIPVHHEVRNPARQWENAVHSRWEEYHPPNPEPQEGMTRFGADDSRPPQRNANRQIVWDNEPLPRPQNQFRSHGPTSDYRPQLREVLNKNNTERRQRELAMNIDEDNRITRPPNRTDFSHDIKNFQPGQRNSRQPESKPFGQPVRIPPPPALPKSNDAYY